MLIQLLWMLSIRTRRLLRTWAPTNILLDRLRARPGAATPAALALLTGVAYLAAACGLAALVEHGWPRWLYLLFFLFLWNAAKFGLYGIGLTLLGLVRLPSRLLCRVRARRAAARHAQQEQEKSASEYACV